MLGSMPIYARPSSVESLEAAIDVLGNRVRVAVIGHLRANGAASRKAIEAAIGVNKSTITLHLSTLIEQGVIVADPPLSEVKRGQVVLYTVDEDRLEELLSTLVTGLGGPRKNDTPR